MAIPNPLPTSGEATAGQGITGGALNITKGTFLAAILSEFLIAFNGVFERIFGENPETWVKPAMMITLVVMWGLIATADVLARGYAHGQNGASAGDVVPLPTALLEGLKVKIDKHGSDPTGRLLALRASGVAEAGAVECLVALDAGGLEWASAAKVKPLQQ